MFKLGDRVNIGWKADDFVITKIADNPAHPGDFIYYLNDDMTDYFQATELIPADKPILQGAFSALASDQRPINVYGQNSNTYIRKLCLYRGKECPEELKDKVVLETIPTKGNIFIRIREDY